MIVVFDQDGQPEQGGQAVAAPKLSAPSKSALKLFTQGLHGPASHGGSRSLHLLIVQMLSMILEVADFPGKGLLVFGRPLGLRFQ